MPVFNSQSLVSSSNYLNKTTGKHATCTKGHDERTERTVIQETCKKQHLIVLTVRIIFWNSSLEFLVFILAIHVPQRLNSFILKNLDSMSNEILFRVLGSKFRMGYLKFIKKDRDQGNAPRYPSNWRLLYWCGYDYCKNEKVILLSFIFILFYF